MPGHRAFEHDVHGNEKQKYFFSPIKMYYTTYKHILKYNCQEDRAVDKALV